MRRSDTAAPAAPPQAVRREDYRPPAFLCDEVELEFDVREDATEVSALLRLRRNPEHGDPDAPLALDGEDLETRSIALDGRRLEAGEYEELPERLTVPNVPDAFTLATRVRVRPHANTQLSGLYASSGNLCTQCEAEGFRRITWYLDRPDVMARYRVRIEADREAYPVLLSNGNRVATEDAGGGRHAAIWEDPSLKPSYLFALVAGKLACVPGTHTTPSGRELRLELWVEPHETDKCEHALESLKEAMRWDEERFGLEYDLDLYMIVAVGDFNMGAMENKGLNVFNSKLVLARPDTATDDDYDRIAAVVAHEYFHNWTGNRVTCRDWFQLTLKEGLTVYRDQRFSSDRGSAAVERIGQVQSLRSRQLPEDAGPMAHPIRPESYISMDNFYTATVYEKGAEVVRLYETLLGVDGFRRGMDLYFERHDGQAVTCDDFRAAMADANGVDLSALERWYAQAGTPVVEVEGAHDAAAKRYTLTLRQRAPQGQDAAAWRPVPIPVRTALLDRAGRELPLRLAGEDGEPTERVLRLDAAEATFAFEGVEAPPVPSVLRGYSAPVLLKADRDRAELAFLAGSDTDPFNRWDAGQELAAQCLLEAADAGGDFALAPQLVEAFRATLVDERLDGSLRALALTLPSEGELAWRQATVDPDALHAARERTKDLLAEALADELATVWRAARPTGPYSADRLAVDGRRLSNCALALLARTGPEWVGRAADQLDSADNMTDAQSALVVLCGLDVPEREAALAAFHERWKHDPLVLDKWFAIQATSPLPDAVQRVTELAEHPDFTLTNPNRVRALLSAFATMNPAAFHEASGAGYRLVGDQLLQLDRKNPQIAARLAGAFNHWKRYDEDRQALQRGQLERLASAELSKDTYEIVSRALG